MSFTADGPWGTTIVDLPDEAKSLRTSRYCVTSIMCTTCPHTLESEALDINSDYSSHDETRTVAFACPVHWCPNADIRYLAAALSNARDMLHNIKRTYGYISQSEQRPQMKLTESIIVHLSPLRQKHRSVHHLSSLQGKVTQNNIVHLFTSQITQIRYH